jgi:hypothetical protein
MGLILKVTTAVNVFRTFGILEVLKLVVRKLRAQSAESLEVNIPSGVRVVAPEELSDDLFSAILRASRVEVRLARAEYERYRKSFEEKARVPREQFFGSIFDLGPRMSEFLFTAILINRPQKIIETGVAAGASTNTILSALKQNSFGKLFSLDITEQVGELVDENLKPLWQLQILPEMGREKAFVKYLRDNSEATLFLHDSDHSDSWQIKEFKNVVREIPDIELILIDDIGQALINFITLNFKNYEVVVFDENRKFSGVIKKN